MYDPFAVLNIEPGASKRVIVDAMARGLRERRASAQDLARAQKALLDPISNAAYAFLMQSGLDEAEPGHGKEPSSAPRDPAATSDRPRLPLARLSVFDDAEAS